MACIHPFKGLRPTTEYAAQVASHPYDVLNSEEARELAKDNPYSFLHVVKSEIDLPAGTDLYDGAVYQKAADNFAKMVKDGVFMQDDAPCLYLYTIEQGDHRQTGLIAATSAEEYLQNIIRKHELTRKVKEDDRIRHIDTLNANSGPVLLTYEAQKDIDALVANIIKRDAEYDFVADDGIRHILHVVSDSTEVSQFVAAFDKLGVLYIADGHHRSAAGGRVYEKRKAANPNHTGEEEYCYFLSVIFPHDQLRILAYNRVVQDLNGMSEEQLLAKLEEKFELLSTGVKEPTESLTFSIYMSGKWYAFKYKGGVSDDPLLRLDVAVLQNEVLGPMLGIEDPRKDERINFVGGTRGVEELEKLVDSGKYAIAFSMFPTSVMDLMNVAEANKIMPPKSTWFAPKLRSGLLVHSLED